MENRSTWLMQLSSAARLNWLTQLSNLEYNVYAIAAKAFARCGHIYSAIYKYIHTKILNRTRSLASLCSLTLTTQQLIILYNAATCLANLGPIGDRI